MMRRFFAGLVCLAFVLAGVQFLPAQTATTGQVAGDVLDPTGAIVLGAKVTLTNEAGVKRETTSDAAGHYLFPMLPPGIYTVEASAKGFGNVKLQHVVVRITETTVVAVPLKLAATAESVVVTAAPPLVQTESATAGKVIEQSSISQLPLPTRNFQQLLALTPGASGSLANSSELGRGDAAIYVNGQRAMSNAVVVNGVDANAIGTGSTPNLSVPATDSMREFIVQTSLYDASQGRSAGGVIAAVTKSGTNGFHGNVYDFFRNTVLNANNFFLNRDHVEKPPLDRNQFGGTLGGPIKKDRAWFFLSYQGTREKNGTSLTNSLATVFVPNVLTNDRSDAALQNLYVKQLAGTAFAPFALLLYNPASPQVKILKQTLPNGQHLIPSSPAGSTCANGAAACAVTTPIPSTSSFQEDQFNANVDLKVTENNRLAVKFFFANNPTTQALYSSFGVGNPLQAPGWPTNVSINQRLASIDDTHIFSATLINNLRIGFSQIAGPSRPAEPVKAADIGITAPLGALFPGMPTLSFSNMMDLGPSPLADNFSQNRTYSLSDMITWSHGKHTLKFGGEYKHHQSDLVFNAYTRGQIFFLGILGNAFSDFLVGMPGLSIIGSGDPSRGNRAQDFAWFVQDDWRIHPRLTLNLGLRYDYYGPFTEAKGRYVAFDPTLAQTTPIPGGVALTGGLVQAGNGSIAGLPKVQDALIASDKNNFAPRIGFAWQPLSSNKLVVRGGYGIYYDRANARLFNVQAFNSPYYSLGMSLIGATYPYLANPFVQVPLPGSYPLDPTTTTPAFLNAMRQANPFLPAGAVSLAVPAVGTYPDRHDFRVPYIQQYNLGFQYNFADNWLLDMAYVGSTGRKLYRLINLNQPPGPSLAVANSAQYSPALSSLAVPPFGTFAVQSSGKSNYNALQTSLTHRFAQGLQFLASYTYAHSLDDYSGTDTSDVTVVPGNQTNLKNWATSDYDRRHRFVFSGTYDLPKLYRGDSGFAQRLVNGWQLGSIFTMQTGLPFSILGSSSVFAVTRADLASGHTLDGVCGSGDVTNRVNKYFDTSAFVAPTANGDFGTTGRNICRGPAQTNVDFSIVKFIPVTERQKVEFRTEFFNLFNTVNFANPNNIMTPASTFGQIFRTSTGPRVIQFALKYSF